MYNFKDDMKKIKGILEDTNKVFRSQVRLKNKILKFNVEKELNFNHFKASDYGKTTA